MEKEQNSVSHASMPVSPLPLCNCFFTEEVDLRRRLDPLTTCFFKLLVLDDSKK